MIKSLLGLAITLSTLILPGICAGAVASPAPAVIVDSSVGLMLALKDADVDNIVLNGSVRLQRSAWKEGEVVIQPGRRVTLTRRDDQAVVMLDMHNIVDAIHVSAGATLELVNITLSNPASAVSLGTTNHTRYVVPWLPSWPSITIEPNATVVKTSTLTYTWSSSGDACDSFRADVANVLGPYGVAQNLSYPNYRQELMHLSGSHNLTQPVVDRIANATVGSILSEEADTRTLCVPLPSDYLVGGDDPTAGLGADALSTQAAQALGAPGQSAGSKRTEKWVIAVSVVGSVAAAAIAAALAVMCSHVHYRRKICQVLQDKGDKDTSHDRDSRMGTSGPVSGHSSLTMGAQATPFVPRSPFEDMRVGLVSASMLRSAPSMPTNGQTMMGAPAGYILAQQGSAASTQGGHPGMPQDSDCISEESVPGSMELALLPAATASTPVSPDRSPRPSFPWALQQRPASFSAAPSALERSASGAPQPPRALTQGRASAPAEALAASEQRMDAVDLTEPSGPACPPSPFLASATPRLSFNCPQLSSRQLAKLAKQASLTSRTSLCSVSSLLTRVTSGLGSQPVAARSPFEKGPMEGSPFDRALSSMLKVNSDSCLTSQDGSSGGSSSQRSLPSIASTPGSHADVNPASKMCFNDSAYADGDRDEIVKARASHPAGKLKADAKTGAPAAKVFDSMTSLPASSHKPPAAAAPAKAVSRFDSVASMPASQQEPKPVKAPQSRASRMSPAVSPRARRSTTSESDFTDLKFGALIGTGSFGRVYKAYWKGAVVAVKVIVHNASMARKVDTLRESLVGISMQHQHVMTTYKVMTTMKAEQMDEVPDARYSTARRNGYSVAHLGPGNATKQEMLETWLLLEYCDGGPLDQAIKNSRFKRTMGTILLSLMDIASGMKYLHSLGIVHSDLKGANVLIKSAKATEKDPRGYVCKLADFGLARVLGSNRTHVSTSTHGTVSYQPMEVLHDGRVTRASDVYSYGMIMLEVFTGLVVFEGFSSSQILYQVFNGVRPAMPDNLPAPYRALIQACWQRDPELRPSFAEVHDKLAAMYNELPACQRPVLAAQ